MAYKILRVNSSLFGNKGVSTQLIDTLIADVAEKLNDVEIVTRDFTQQAIPHIDADWIHALMTPIENKTDDELTKTQFSDRLIDEVNQADFIVIAAPMYNFNVPSMLKAWFDHLARAGVTFKYTEKGPVGLVADKPVVVVTTRGGIHKNSASDSEVQFIRSFLNFIGLQKIEFVYAEGLNMQNHKEQALVSAKEQIAQVITAI